MAQDRPKEVTKVGGYARTIEDSNQDFRGLDLYTRDGEHIGSVEDLWVEAEEQKVRFLDVGAGGFLGMGEKHFLIPVEAVTDVSEDRVTVDHSREKVTEMPDAPRESAVLNPEQQEEIYDYYGYSYPV